MDVGFFSSAVGPVAMAVAVAGPSGGGGLKDSCETTRSLHSVAPQQSNAAMASPKPNPDASPNPNLKPSPSPSPNSSLFPAFIPARRSLFPSPLKFLWFNNQKNQDILSDAETSVPDLSAGRMSEIRLNDDLTQPIYPMPHLNNIELSLNDETSQLKNRQNHPISLNQQPFPNLWVSRFLAISSLWQSRKKNTSLTAPSVYSEVAESNVTEAEAYKKSCSGCSQDACEWCHIEVAYSGVSHTRDSFSKFLQHVSLFDARIISQMSYLCDIAYSISDIKPGELLKGHRLKFVTSSLEKKAEAKEKVKDLSAASATLSKSNPMAKQKQDETSIAEMWALANKNEKHQVGTVYTEVVNAPIAADEEKVRREVEPHDSISCSKYSFDGNTVFKQLDALQEPSPFDVSALDVATPAVVAEEETKQAIAKALQLLNAAPCEWYICDDPDSHTRIFVIQGSESLASWQANLSFEPTKFEGLGVLAHRGVYEAAKGIYEQVLPDVVAHLRAHGECAKIRFTGHSLGGSLSVLIVLMLLLRGVVSNTSFLLPVVTFGAPYVMCGGDFLLQKLKLNPNFIQSVMMHKDIVPRAFACNYPDHVAEVLKRLNGNFRDHPCLKNQRLLYAPMGQMLILQPEGRESPLHPLLPEGCGLYGVGHINHGHDDMKAIELRAAQRAFLNLPHPLDILRDPGAYGFGGAISRDHDSGSYLKAVHAVLKHELRRKRRLLREQRRKCFWPLVVGKSSLVVQKGASLACVEGGPVINSALGKSSYTTLSTYAMTNSEFPVGSLSIRKPRNEVIRKYARLIASQHIQMGIFLIVSVNMLIAEGFTSFFVWI